MERESARRASAMKKQRLLQAEIEGETQAASMKWQMKLQAQQEAQSMAMQNEMAKDQAAFQGEQQTKAMSDQAAMQQGGQPGPTPPEQRPAPRNPSLMPSGPPPEIQSPLTMRSVSPVPLNATGEQLGGRANVDLLLMGRKLADKISGLSPSVQPRALAELRTQQPELHDMVLGLMMSGSGGPTQAATAAARPLPEQRPARRGPESQLV